ncbi:MAG: M28 family peptidase [bacterium]|nr:M28 family peptidase [bacterium]
MSALSLALVLISPPASAYTAEQIEHAARAATQVKAATRHLASDALMGREAGTEGSLAAQDSLIATLSESAQGLFGDEQGDDVFRQPFVYPSTGTNILGIIEGRELPDEYVLVGAHYDHLGATCSSPGVCQRIFNGATDNAAGAAIVLAIGRALRELPTPPRRSVILALWDGEEDGLAGAAAFVLKGTIPLGRIVAYVNFDIQGANLLPSLRNTSFAIGAETGGFRLRQMVQAAVDAQTLDVDPLTLVFGQDRSDHAIFYPQSVPIVFFSDSTGGCYHTASDDNSVVDFRKLAQQSQIGFRLTLDLAETRSPPSFEASSAVVYQDAVVISEQLTAALADLTLFSTRDRSQLVALEEQFRLDVAAGPEAFTPAHQFATVSGASELVEILTHTQCDGYLPVPEPSREALVLAALAAVGVLRRGRG